MAEIIIRVTIADDMADLFVGRDFMVTPLSDFEAGQLASALEGTARTIAALADPDPTAVAQVDFVRSLLGRSARVGREDSDDARKAVLQ